MPEEPSKSGSEIKDLLVASFCFLLIVQLFAVILTVLSLDNITELRLGLEAVIFCAIALSLNRKYPLRFSKSASDYLTQYVCLGLAFSVLHFIPYFMALSRGQKPPEQYLEYAILSPVRGIVFLLLVIIILPFLEEIIFRGFFYRLLAKRTNNITAIIISSLVFTAGHGFHSGWFYNHFMLGVICCYIYSKSNSIWSSIITHSANNAVFYFGSIMFVKHKLF
jgi:membrane protease YdiL (CAAX protease family)